MYTILIIDDEADMLDLMATLLRQEGYAVITAENGLEGVKKAKELLPSLVLADIHMPVMDGLEACRQIKSDETTKNIPVVMLTVAGQMSEIQKAMMYGAKTYVTKPCPREQILKVIEDILPQDKPQHTDWLHSSRSDEEKNRLQD
ncbi:MAG: response regulator [bacterium]